MNADEAKKRFFEQLNQLSTISRGFWLNAYLSSRPENEDVRSYPDIEWQRMQNTMLQEIRDEVREMRMKRDAWNSAGKQAVNLFFSKIGWK